MGVEPRHAAWHTRSYAVRLPARDAPSQELAGGLETFLDALELATEWLDREDPQRGGARAIAIVELRDGAEEEVWAFPAPEPQQREELVDVFGFDPVAWTPRRLEYASKRWTARLPDAGRAPLPELELPVQLEEDPEPEPVVAAEPRARRDERPERSSIVVALQVPRPRLALPRRPSLPQRLPSRREVETAARVAWQDLPSRYLLFVAVAGAWLTVALLEASFVVVPLVALAALRWRLRTRALTAEPDDWF